MKYYSISLFFFVSFALSAQNNTVKTANNSPTNSQASTKSEIKKIEINWMTWEEAYEANKLNPKKVFVDIYTSWCGWCKKMDKSTFQDAGIIKELNDNFYAIKFDAEQKNNIIFNEATFKYVGQGRRGSHQLAYALLDGRMGYPAFVMLDENFHRIVLAPGYKRADELMVQLKYSSTEAYKKINYQEFEKGYKQ